MSFSDSTPEQSHSQGTRSVPTEDEVAALREENEALRTRLKRLEDEVTELRAAVEANAEPKPETKDETATDLDEASRGSKSHRRERLGRYEFIATVIHRNWDALSWIDATPNGESPCVDTQRRSMVEKHTPSKFKTDLERELNEDLRWKTVYRAMQTTARLAARDPDEAIRERTDGEGSLHITGGRYEYHEVPADGDKAARKVLQEVQ